MQRRARKQEVDLAYNRLLTRAVPLLCPNVVRFRADCKWVYGVGRFV